MGKRLAFTFALTGRRDWEHGTQGVALGILAAQLRFAAFICKLSALDLLGFQPAHGRRQGFFRTISTYLIFQF